MKKVSLSVVIPVYNERKTIREIIARVKAEPREKEIIIVDDCSTDGTRAILAEYASDPEIRIIYQMKNSGKGAAIRTGFAACEKEVVIVQDADLEYSPSDYPVLLEPIEEGVADVVFGSRFLHGKRRVLYFWHSLGNRVLTLFSNVMTDLNLTDMETCYKVFKRQIIQNIILESDRFGFEPEITAKVAKLHCNIYEVPINYYGRSYEEGKKITWKDGVAAFRHILKYSLSRKNFVKDRAALNSVLVFPPTTSDVGVETLEAFECAKAYNNWIFERFAPFVGEKVIEVGSGIGNIIGEILSTSKAKSVTATDLSGSSLATLKTRFATDARLKTAVWNAEEPPSRELEPGTYDTVICSNVLEHIEHQEKALDHMKLLLKPGGRLIVLVPAGQMIYSKIDEELGHFRRYTKDSLTKVFQSQGLGVESVFYHNLVGAIGWWWSGKVMGGSQVTTKQVKAFDALVPFLKIVDPLLTTLFGGVSVIAVSKPIDSGQQRGKVINF